MSTDPKGNKKTEIFDKTGRLKAVKNGDVNEKDSAVYEYYLTEAGRVLYMKVG